VSRAEACYRKWCSERQEQRRQLKMREEKEAEEKVSFWLCSHIIGANINYEGVPTTQWQLCLGGSTKPHP
jgi:prenyltransferase beta subunit